MADTAVRATESDADGHDFSGATGVWVSTTGNDSNDGLSVGNPKLTLAAAIAVVDTQRASADVHLRIGAGTYREVFQYTSGANRTTNYLKIEPINGDVTITGADNWQGSWTNDSGNRWWRTWTDNWGTYAKPSGWESVDPSEETRRREGVFMNFSGTYKPLKQVMSLGALGSGTDYESEGTFYVDEAADRLYIEHTTTSPNTTGPEVVRRGGTWHFNGVDNVYVDCSGAYDITVQYDSGCIGDDQLGNKFLNCENIYVEGMNFQWNLGGNISCQFGDRITFDTCLIDYAGFTGSDANSMTNVVMKDTDFTGNNWKGVMYGWVGWAAGAVKHLLIHKAHYIRCEFLDNYTYGWWIDTDAADIVLENCAVGDNDEQFGIFLEAFQGPMTIKSCAIYRNGTSSTGGILIGNAESVHWEDNDIYDNTNTNFSFGGVVAGRSFNDFETGDPYTAQLCPNWSFHHNRIVNKGSGELLFLFNVQDCLTDVTKGLPTATFEAQVDFDNDARDIYWNGDDDQIVRQGSLYDINNFLAHTGGDEAGWWLDPGYTSPDAATPNFGLGIAEVDILPDIYMDVEMFENDDLTSSAGTWRIRTPFDWQFAYAELASVITSSDTWSMRITGQLLPEYSETYTFYVTMDDGAKLIVDGETVIDQFSRNGSASEFSGVMSGSFTADQPVSFTLEFRDNTGQATCEVRWSSASQAKEVIPVNRYRRTGYTGNPEVDPITNKTYSESETIPQILITGYDPDNQTITYSVAGLPSALAYSASPPKITGTTASDSGDNSPYTVTVTGTDTDGNEGTTQFTITITGGAGGGPDPCSYGGTFEDLAQSHDIAGRLLRRYRMKDASGGTVSNVANGNTGTDYDLVYSGASITTGNAGPTSEFQGLLVAGTDAKLYIKHQSDLADLNNQMILMIWKQTGISNVNSRLWRHGSWTHSYMQFDTGPELELRVKHTQSMNQDTTNWSHAGVDEVLAIGWTNDNTPAVGYKGPVGDNDPIGTLTGWSTNITGTVESVSGDLYVFSDQWTADRIVECTLYEVWILNTELTQAQVEEIQCRAGEEYAEPQDPNNGITFGAKVSISGKVLKGL